MDRISPSAFSKLTPIFPVSPTFSSLALPPPLTTHTYRNVTQINNARAQWDFAGFLAANKESLKPVADNYFRVSSE